MKGRFFKTKYRIVRDAYNGYEVQFRFWWWPFWSQVQINTAHTAAEAKAWLIGRLEWKRQKREKRREIGRVVEVINDL